MLKQMFVYILCNPHRNVLYVGVTNNLRRRVQEHRNPVKRCFTSRYNVTRLVWFEVLWGPTVAIRREKQIKAGSRARKVALIEKSNPTWRDLYDEL